MAQDSAEGVYAEALKLMQVDVSGVHPSAYRHILLAQPKPKGEEIVAMDAKSVSGFYEVFPEAKRIK